MNSVPMVWAVVPVTALCYALCYISLLFYISLLCYISLLSSFENEQGFDESSEKHVGL
jgi:hypothetical protein